VIKKIVFITELELDRDPGAALSRILELSKSFSLLVSSVYISSVVYDNSKHIINKVSDKYSIFTLGQFKEDYRNFYQKKYFSFNRKQKELDYICSYFESENRETLFIIYDYLSTFFDEILSVKKLKGKGYKVIVEKNELSLGIELSKSIPAGIKGLLLLMLKPIELLNAWLVDELVRSYDGVMVISRYIEEYVKARNKNPVIRIPVLSPKIIDTNFLDFEKHKTLKIGYFGTLTYKRDQIHQLLCAINILKKKYKINNIRLTLTGSGNIRIINRIKKFIDRNELEDNIKYLGYLHNDDVLDVQKKQHILVVLRKSNLQGEASFATKLANYMHLGKLVIATNVSDNSLYIENKKNGFLIESNQPRIIAKKIVEIIKLEKSEIFEISNKAKETATRYFYFRNYTKLINEFINSISNLK